MSIASVETKPQPGAAVQPPSAAWGTARLTSLDAYRGLAMFLMLAEMLHLSRVAEAVSGSRLWAFLAHHQTHVEWAGCTLHDLIQPSFTFMVGVSLPFSLASRRARGNSLGTMTAHAFWRALVLVLLGVFLRSLRHSQTNWTFEDTLTQIGLGYGFLFLLGLRPIRDQLIALGLILVGYWAAFALYPLPGPNFDWAAAGVAPDWPHHFQGFAAHWNKNTNAAWAFDTWFMNLFSREEPFRFNRGGYSTLSFLPTLGTMILGLLAGEILRSDATPAQKIKGLLLASAICFALALIPAWLGVSPIVKRIWTPGWTLFSGGWCFAIMAAFYAVIDVAGWKAWAFPLVVIGVNSIVAYCMEWLAAGFVHDALLRHIGEDAFRTFGPAYEPLVLGALTLLILWLILLWMYRRKVFVRI
jgi:predicted acyltransferase